MASERDKFGEALPGWRESNATPWGRLRREMAWENIARHTGDRPLRVLDVGGGDGLDAIHFAELGHSVTLTDYSPTMLAEAEASARARGVAERLVLCETGPEALPESLRGARFDLVLCHMMIEFVPDAQALLGGMCELLSAGGLLSLLDTNRYSDVYLRALQFGDLRAAREAVGARTYHHPWVDRLTPRFSAEEFIDELGRHGCSLSGQYGVLSVCAYVPNERKFDEGYFAELQELERLLTATYPYYLLARFFQLIARKG